MEVILKIFGLAAAVGAGSCWATVWRHCTWPIFPGSVFTPVGLLGSLVMALVSGLASAPWNVQHQQPPGDGCFRPHSGSPAQTIWRRQPGTHFCNRWPLPDARCPRRSLASAQVLSSVSSRLLLAPACAAWLVAPVGCSGIGRSGPLCIP